eukprot:scaffold229102_cov58-Attheya_sp.AAC.1
MLELRRNHNLPTWALFVDLVKAFDTANHALMYIILKKYGVPPQLCNAIERLYKGASVNLKVGTADSRSIPYTVGVKQGNAMAPVLFLFLIQAFAETLEEEWEDADIDIPTFNYHENREKPIGRLVGKRSQSKGSLLLLNNLLYVDDGAFIFTSRPDMEKAASIIFEHFAKLGLIMHIGTGGKKSKTEAVYYPPKLLGKGEIPVVNEEDTFTIRDGYIGFTNNFRYLGSIINSDLRDIHEIKKRIQKATNQMHELTHLCEEQTHRTGNQSMAIPSPTSQHPSTVGM